MIKNLFTEYSKNIFGINAIGAIKPSLHAINKCFTKLNVDATIDLSTLTLSH